MKLNVIFVAGVHGVGKSHLGELLSSKYNMPHYSASTLIKNLKQEDVDLEKKVLDADINQDYLLLALDNLSTEKGKIILDGHFCLLKEDDIFEVPLDTFRSLSLSGVILLTNDIDQIQKRMVQRDGKALDKEQMEALQIKEIERAKVVVQHLNIPLLISDVDNYQDIFSWLEKSLNI